jgi:hypothetical protein
MASKVNRQSISVEDFYLLFCAVASELVDSAFGLRRSFRTAVATVWLHQTANQGQSRPAFRLDLPAAGALARALENHAFPASALQSIKIALRAAVFVQT